jgi:hypothetical protein
MLRHEQSGTQDPIAVASDELFLWSVGRQLERVEKGKHIRPQEN